MRKERLKRGASEEDRGATGGTQRKSGRLKVASRSLEQFKNKFNKDLIYPDGSSFTRNAESILDFSNDKGSLNLEMTNNNQKIKSELKRAWYWIKK